MYYYRGKYSSPLKHVDTLLCCSIKVFKCYRVTEFKGLLDFKAVE